MSSINLKEWLIHEKESFNQGRINEAFIIYNVLLIKEYFNLKRRGLEEAQIRKQLNISDDLFDFWVKSFSGEDFIKKTSDIKKELIIRELKKDKSIDGVLKSVGISKREFDKLYILSKNYDNEFYQEFNKHYTQKRQRLFVKNLKHQNIIGAVKRSKISNPEFIEWYFEGEISYSEFYLDTTRILMEKYLKSRKQGLNKKDILEKIGISREIFKSWMQHDDLDLFREFKVKNNDITSNLLKRGLIINALKEGKTKSEAISCAKISEDEFNEIYQTSRIEKTDFYLRFNLEYCENRKRQFVKHLKTNDFYNAIVKSDMSQKEFNKWYAYDESRVLGGERASDFYINTTKLLMDKYIESRRSGKNKPDSARCVGLSNLTIDNG